MQTLISERKLNAYKKTNLAKTSGLPGIKKLKMALEWKILWHGVFVICHYFAELIYYILLLNSIQLILISHLLCLKVLLN